MSLSFHHLQSDHKSASTPELLNPVPQSANEMLKEAATAPAPRKLAPSLWLRAMTDFDAPFGRDGLPTVWG